MNCEVNSNTIKTDDIKTVPSNKQSKNLSEVNIFLDSFSPRNSRNSRNNHNHNISMPKETRRNSKPGIAMAKLNSYDHPDYGAEDLVGESNVSSDPDSLAKEQETVKVRTFHA